LRRVRGSVMVDIFAWLISLAVTLPMLTLVILFLILRIVVKNKKKSIMLTVDLSTFFFIVSVHFHLLTLFKQSFLSFIILGLMCLTLVVYYIEYKRSKAPTITRVSKKVWRMSFLLFFVIYLVLAFYGISSGIIKNASI
jgi:uncharacterized membrane protein YozB (DUF420 family)